MFAIIKTGSKQYKVTKDSIIVIEKVSGVAGDKVEFDQVLMLDGTVGTPVVDGAKVVGEIVKQSRGEKVIVFKKRRRQGYRRKNGHKQELSVVKILEVKGA